MIADQRYASLWTRGSTSFAGLRSLARRRNAGHAVTVGLTSDQRGTKSLHRYRAARRSNAIAISACVEYEISELSAAPDAPSGGMRSRFAPRFVTTATA